MVTRVDRVSPIYLPEPREYQEELLLSPARYKVAACGRRWGKTMAGLIAVVDGHGANRELIGAAQGGNIWWVAPNYPIETLIWDELRISLKGAWTRKSEVERRIILPTGGSVTVKSAHEPDSLRGTGLDGVVMDEAATCDERAWYEALRPALMDRQGWALFIGTPKGENWFQRLFDGATALLWARWQRPSMDNPDVTEEEIEATRLTMGSAGFRQEIMAEFVGAEELATFKRVWWRQYKVLPADLHLGGIFVDMAHTEADTADYSVLATWRSDGNRFYLVDVVRDRMEFPELERAIRQARVFHNLPVVIEETPGSLPLIQHLWQTLSPIIGWKIQGRSKLARAQSVTPYVEAGNCYLPEGEPWVVPFIEEHARFPLGEHDDMVDTSTMALMYLTQHGPSEVMETVGVPMGQWWRKAR